MKHTTLIAVALLAAVSSGLFAADGNFGAPGAKNKTGLSLEEMLTYAIQDEFLARAEYEAIIERHGKLPPSANIVRSEELHISWLREAFAAHGLVVPAERGGERIVAAADLKTAYENGVQAEIENIAMYRAFLGGAAEAPLPADVRQLFERLAVASENHLKAFERNLSRRGRTDSPRVACIERRRIAGRN